MNSIRRIIHFLSHLHRYLDVLVNTLGNYTYLVILLNFILESGGLILGFLPGDSLVVASAAYAAYKPLKLNIFILYLTILAGTMIGDAISFHIGMFLGNKYKSKSNFRFITKEQFNQVHSFFEKNGKKSFFINRFIPFARAWLPFVAGFTGSKYLTIMPYNMAGCFIWTTTYTIMGYFFGNRRFIRDQFSIIFLIVFVISMIPAIILYLYNRKKIHAKFNKKTNVETDDPKESDTEISTVSGSNSDTLDKIDSESNNEDSADNNIDSING